MTERIRTAILDLAVDDYHGLWELRWRAHTLWPEVGDELDAAVRSELLAMLDEGLVELVELEEDGATAAPLPAEAVTEAVRSDVAWHPESGTRIRAAATTKGESAYYGARPAG